METTKLEGKILWYNDKRMIGTIITLADPQRRYFFHQAGLISGPQNPLPEMPCTFVPSNRPPSPGKLPVATRIEILISAGAAELGGAR